MARARKAPSESPHEKFLLRVPQTTMQVIRHFAARHRRTVTSEVQVALDLYVSEAMLDAIDNDPEFVREITAHGVDLDAFRARTVEDRKKLRDAAFLRRPSYEQVADALAKAAS